VKYLRFIYIFEYRFRFVKCYTNEVLHFNTTITSRDESDHFTLKKRLSFSIEDLKTMMNDIDLLLKNELHNYHLALEKAKIRFFMSFRKSIFQNLIAYVIFHVLKMILEQYNLLTERSTIFSRCTNVFIITIDLSCSHKIQERLYNEEFLLLKDVHVH
jgi:hypothetical protein